MEENDWFFGLWDNNDDFFYDWEYDPYEEYVDNSLERRYQELLDYEAGLAVPEDA